MKMLKMFLKHPQLLEFTGWGDGKLISEATRAEVFELVKQARIFVISRESIDNTFEKERSDGCVNFDKVDLSPPFPVCWFEASLGGEMVLLFGGKVKRASVGILVKEVSPSVFDLFTLEGNLRDGTLYTSVSVFRGVTNDFGDKTALATIKLWLASLNNGTLVVEKTDQVIHIPRPDRPAKTKPHTINRIIRIVPHECRQNKTLLPMTNNGIIDWSHRWECRGHWRKVDTVGKDRSGDYNVSGFTWVREHIKGPDNKPLIKKIRIVKGDKI